MKDMQEYLEATDVVDWQHDSVLALAAELTRHNDDQVSLAKTTFEWVRDNIEHCLDFNRCEVTCTASDVLSVGTGFCYAKSHLLAALLRANEIPAGFCYQRLSLSGDGPPYSLHGLNAVFLASYGWYRIDARGNSASVCAEFVPPEERLAFKTDDVGEVDFPEVLSAPLQCVVTALTSETSVAALVNKLPDVTTMELTG